MDPMKMIEKLPKLMQDVNKHVWQIGVEADQVTEEWIGLGHAGGQRADHAALLMARLRPLFAELSRFCIKVELQLTEMVKDPFEREKDTLVLSERIS